MKQLIDGITGHAVCRATIRGELSRISQVAAWLDLNRMALHRKLSRLAQSDSSLLTDPEFAAAARTSVYEAKRVKERAETGDRFPSVASGLDDGNVTANHLDAITDATKILSDEQRNAISQHDVRLARIASQVGPAEFARIVRQYVHDVLSESDAVQLLQQQRAAIRLKHWIDQSTGMWHIHGIFDPESGAFLEAKIAAETEVYFRAGTTVAGAPTDTSERQAFLRACALVTTLCPPVTMDVPDSATAHTEICVVIDEKTLATGQRHDQTVCTTNNGSNLPATTIQRLACSAEMVPIVIDPDGIVINIGRGQRLATLHQRRALRTLYESCAIAECNVRFDYCEPHHIKFWRHGGLTDLDNLVPLCSTHHHAAHEGRWYLELDAHRTLTATRPDGTQLTSPMPIRRANERGTGPPPKAA